jgi:hypothetical protein
VRPNALNTTSLSRISGTDGGTIDADSTRPLFNDNYYNQKLIRSSHKAPDKVNSLLGHDQQQAPLHNLDFASLLYSEQMKNKQLVEENKKLRQIMPESYTEMRVRERQVQERMSRYEQAIVDYENEKKSLYETMKLKDEDIAFIKNKYEEANTLWHQENLEKQKLETVIDQQYREAMELDTFRRRSDDDKNIYRSKNVLLKTQVEDLIKENKKLLDDKF